MTTFTISLLQVGPIVRSGIRKTYDPHLDNITTVLIDICESLSAGVRFVAAGFGQERWPVDVGTDLAVVIEQLPAVIRALGGGRPATLDFYEQGIQRVVTMDWAGADLVLECQSMTSWEPEPSVVRMGGVEVIEMLRSFVDRFVNLAALGCPDLVKHPWFQTWVRVE